MPKLHYISSSLIALSLCGLAQTAFAATDPSEMTESKRDRIKAEISSEILGLTSHRTQSQSYIPPALPAVAAKKKVTPNDISADIAAEMASGEPRAIPLSVSQADSIDLKGLLLSSHVASGLQMKTGDSNAFKWTSNGLSGSARQYPLSAGKSLSDTASEYVSHTASECRGDFARKIKQEQTAGRYKVLEVNVTCIDGHNDAAAAALFVGSKDTYSVITEQGRIDQLHTALSDRDAIIAAAKGNIASNITESVTPPVTAPIPVSGADDPPAYVPPPAIAADAIPQEQEMAVAPYEPSFTAQPEKPRKRLKVELGMDTSAYKYRERADTDPFVNLSGYPVGILVAVTTPPMFWKDTYLRGEGKASIGHVDYSSASGQMHNRRDYYGEIRGLIVKDFVFNKNTVSPYTGAGWRYLYNDSRGVTNTGSNGYRRINQTKYIPVGLTNTYKMSDALAVSGNIEYDIFTGGLQKSYLQDADPALGDIMNRQHHGKGVRGNALLHFGTWSVGPWFSFWHIHDSDIVPIPGLPGFGGQEPDNKTTEFGVMVMKQVW